MKGLRCPDCGSRIEYEYGERYGGFSVKCDCVAEHYCKMFYKPKCVRAFGGKADL